MTLQFKQNSLEYLFNGSYSGPTRRAIVALTYTHTAVGQLRADFLTFQHMYGQWNSNCALLFIKLGSMFIVCPSQRLSSPHAP
jgi:hypothetical protein